MGVNTYTRTDRKLCDGACGRLLPNTSEFFRARLKNGNVTLSATCKKCRYMADREKRSAREHKQVVHRTTAVSKKAAHFEETLERLEARFGPQRNWTMEQHAAFTRALQGDDVEMEPVRRRNVTVDYSSPFFRGR